MLKICWKNVEKIIHAQFFILTTLMKGLKMKPEEFLKIEIFGAIRNFFAKPLTNSALLFVKIQQVKLHSSLKFSKSQKQIMAPCILPKNERWVNFHYIKLPQRSFFWRIQDNIFFFKIFWPLVFGRSVLTSQIMPTKVSFTHRCRSK